MEVKVYVAISVQMSETDKTVLKNKFNVLESKLDVMGSKLLAEIKLIQDKST